MTYEDAKPGTGVIWRPASTSRRGVIVHRGRVVDQLFTDRGCAIAVYKRHEWASRDAFRDFIARSTGNARLKHFRCLSVPCGVLIEVWMGDHAVYYAPRVEDLTAHG